MVQTKTLIILLGVIIISIVFYRYNHSINLVKDEEVAKSGKYSDSDNYENITPMKHDIYKQLTIDIIIGLVIYLFLELWQAKSNYFQLSDFISFKNFRKFRTSIIGQSLMTVLGYVVYYQIVQPYFVNRTAKF